MSTISCKITVDGEVISEQTSTGEYALVCAPPVKVGRLWSGFVSEA